MQDNFDKDFKKLVDLVKKHDVNGQASSHSPTSTDAGSGNAPSEQKITMFGHTFTLAELDTVSRFASQLEIAADSVLNKTQLVDGAIFIVKVMNKETQVSFGGIAKR